VSHLSHAKAQSPQSGNEFKVFDCGAAALGSSAKSVVKKTGFSEFASDTGMVKVRQ
jgi:hypothetical protein